MTVSARACARLILLFLLATALIVSLSAISALNTRRYRRQTDWIQHSYQVKIALFGILYGIRSSQSDLRSYVLTGRKDLLTAFRAALPRIETRVTGLAHMVADNPRQRQRARHLGTLIDKRNSALEHVVSLYAKQGRDQALLELIAQARHDENAPLLMLDRQIDEAEDAILLQRKQALATSAVRTHILSLAALAGSLAMLLAALILTLREQRQRSMAERQLHDAHAELLQVLEASRDQAVQLSRLASLGEVLQSCRSRDEVRGVAQANLPDLLPGCAGVLQLINASQNLVETAAGWGELPMSCESLYSPDECWALRRGQPYPLAGTHAAFSCQHVAWPDPERAELNYLCLPLMGQGGALGILHLQGPFPFQAGRRRLAHAAAEHIALAMANVDLQETLRTQAIRDPLTGLFNRRYLDVSIQRELLRAERRGLGLAVMMLDIDHFKRFNDTHGHDAGDALLAQFGGMLLKHSRAEDIACRFRGRGIHPDPAGDRCRHRPGPGTEPSRSNSGARGRASTQGPGSGHDLDRAGPVPGQWRKCRELAERGRCSALPRQTRGTQPRRGRQRRRR